MPAMPSIHWFKAIRDAIKPQLPPAEFEAFCLLPSDPDGLDKGLDVLDRAAPIDGGWRNVPVDDIPKRLAIRAEML